MDYRAQSLIFKVKKTLRYARMYGVRRTLIKVRAYSHLQRRFDQLPPKGGTVASSQTVGLIGCGNYAFSNLAYYLTRSCGRVIGGCMDKDVSRAASLSQYYRVPLYTADAAELIEHPGIRLIYIASNHASHAEYAIEVLKQNKDVYIEKPHVVNEDQLSRLVEAMERSTGRVYLGFNRPGSRLGRLVQHYLGEEDGTAMFNWFVAGHAIDPDHWYFHPREGGRVLGNLCHWTDFLYVMAGADAFPIEIRPTRAVKSDTDIVVTFVFGDGSIGAITFSAKGHTFEGVKERLCVHKGNCLMVLDDFQRLTVEVLDRKRHYRNFYREHGHQTNIVGAFNNSAHRQPYDRRQHTTRIANTALLFLKTKEALEQNRPVLVQPYELARPLARAS